MDVLITGLNNYLAQDVAICLATYDYRVTCLVRNKRHVSRVAEGKYGINLVEANLFREVKDVRISAQTNVGFFFSQSPVNDSELRISMDMLALDRYLDILRQANCEHLIYVTKLLDDGRLHLIRRHLFNSGFTHTIVRVSNIIGKGSSLMRVFSRLERRPLIMFSKEFETNSCQPVALSDVCRILHGIMLDPQAYGQVLDIGGKEVMTYRAMFERYLKVINRPRPAFRLPLRSSRVTSFVYRYFYRLEHDLVEALEANIGHDVVCKHGKLALQLPLEMVPFDDAVRQALGIPDKGRNTGRKTKNFSLSDE